MFPCKRSWNIFRSDHIEWSVFTKEEIFIELGVSDLWARTVIAPFLEVKYSSCFLRHATFTVNEVLSTFFEFLIIHSAYPQTFA